MWHALLCARPPTCTGARTPTAKALSDWLVLMAVVLQGVAGQGSHRMGAAAKKQPSFAEPISNVTVASGRTVTLACVVENLGNYKVAWIHTSRHMLISMDRMLVTTDPRFAINSNGERTWYLTISPVQDVDKGEYMCQINTNPMKKLFGYLHVVVPPKIDEEFSSSEVTVRESSNVTLRCRATGNPQPDIRWKRDHDLKIYTSPDDKGVTFYHGEYLNMNRVLRHQMGPYFCIGSNGVPPSISKRIKVNVAFPPMTWIREQLRGVPIFDGVNLTCEIEAYPRGEAYWTRDDGVRLERAVTAGSNAGGGFGDDEQRHQVVALPRGSAEYRYDLVLSIRRVLAEDYGAYKCVTKNPLGETEAIVKLFETPRPTTPATKSTKPYRKAKRPTSSPKHEKSTKSHYPTRTTTTEGYEEHPSLNDIALYSDGSATGCYATHRRVISMQLAVAALWRALAVIA